MLWFTPSSETMPTPSIIIAREPTKVENPAKQKVIALAKVWKEQAEVHYKTAEAAIRKHPYIAGGLSLLALGALLKGVSAWITPLQPIQTTSTATPPPPPAPIPELKTPTSTTSATPLVTKVTVDQLPALPASDSKLSTPTQDVPQTDTSILSSVGNLFHTMVSSGNEPSADSKTEIKEEQIESKKKDVLLPISNQEEKTSSKLTDDNKQSTIGGVFQGIKSLFTTAPPEPKWHAFITEHEYYPNAKIITGLAVVYLAIHIIMRGTGDHKK